MYMQQIIKCSLVAEQHDHYVYRTLMVASTWLQEIPSPEYTSPRHLK